MCLSHKGSRKECLLCIPNFFFITVVFLQEFSLYPNPGQAGVKRSDGVSQGHEFFLFTPYHRGLKLRDPLMIDRAGHTSREELLKVLKEKEGPLALELVPSSPPCHFSKTYNSLHSTSSLRAWGTGKSY